jgi:hypothetical protein
MSKSVELIILGESDKQISKDMVSIPETECMLEIFVHVNRFVYKQYGKKINRWHFVTIDNNNNYVHIQGRVSIGISPDDYLKSSGGKIILSEMPFPKFN